VTAETPDPAAVRALLAEVGEDAGELELSPVEGGASRQTFMVAAEGVPRYVLRREPAEGMSFATLELELRAIAAADLAGVTVARTVAAEPAGGRLGPGAGYLMEFVEGTSVAPRVLRRDELAIARERLPRQLASALAQIHSVDPQAVDGLAGAATRRSRRASSGSGRWTRSARRCLEWRPGCAGCASTGRRRRSAPRSCTATSGSATSSSTSTAWPP
jgi:aminoglycoside phosphotransferase (APT) family kinase protein